MSNLNKTYHKGKYRGGEWAKHLRPYLKRLGNKRFRKVAAILEEREYEEFKRSTRKKSKKIIKAKITTKLFSDKKHSYYKSYRTMRDFENAIKRPSVIQYSIINNTEKAQNE